MPSQATDLPFFPQLYQPWQNAPHLGTLVGTDTPNLINALPPPSQKGRRVPDIRDSISQPLHKSKPTAG